MGPNVVYSAAIAREGDRLRIADHLGISEAELCQKYEINPSDGHMRNDKEPCRFLGKDSLCTVHEVKPLLCKAYPWKSIFESAEKKIEFYTRCEGLELDGEDISDIRQFLGAVNQDVEKINPDALKETDDPAWMWNQFSLSGSIPTRDQSKVVLEAVQVRQMKAREKYQSNACPV
jgi:Fe-S-cluster containining protein